MTSKLLALLVAASALLPAVHARAGAEAQAFPNKPVTLVIPFATGGSSDAIGRILGQELSRRWKQPVIIENRPGGQTVPGTAFTTKAAPDGYTIGFVSYAWTTNQFLKTNLPYKTSDLMPVTLLGRYPLALFVKGDLAVKSLAEFVAYAKKANRPMSFGHTGIGSSSHLAALELADTLGINIVPVTYKNGTIGAVNELAGGEIDALFEGRTFKQYVDVRRLKALVLAGPKRLPNWTELPAAPEEGYPDLDMAGYYGLMVPANTPVATRNQINADVAAALKNPRVEERLRAIGVQPASMTPEQFGAFLTTQRIKLGALIERHREQLND